MPSFLKNGTFITKTKLFYYPNAYFLFTIFPIQTFFPCKDFTKNIMPAKMKKKGPKKPNNAMNLVP